MGQQHFQADNFGGKGTRAHKAANTYASWIDRYTEAKAQGMTEDEALEYAKKGK